jgi:hypothetical protein
MLKARRLGKGRNSAATIPELKDASQAAYAAAEQGTGTISQSGLQTLAAKAQELITEAGGRPGLHPASFDAFYALMEEATRPGVVGSGLKGMETLRRALTNAENAANRAKNADDARIARGIVDDFDDFMDNLSPKDLVGNVGDAHLTSQNYQVARQYWHRMRKAQDIEALFERARNATDNFTQAGFNNSLRIQFRQLADNPRRFKRFTPDERTAILKVVRGGPAQSLLTWASKLAPRGLVSGAVTGIAGHALGGPAGMLALMGIGEVARSGAGAMRAGAANRVAALVRGPSPVSRMPASGGALPQSGILPTAFTAEQLENEKRRRLAEQLGRR